MGLWVTAGQNGNRIHQSLLLETRLKMNEASPYYHLLGLTVLLTITTSRGGRPCYFHFVEEEADMVRVTGPRAHTWRERNSEPGLCFQIWALPSLMTKGMGVMKDLVSHKAACTERAGAAWKVCLREALCPEAGGTQTLSMSLEALRAQGLPLPHGPGESHVLETHDQRWDPMPLPQPGAHFQPPGSFRARNHGEMDTPALTSVWPGRKAASLEKPL